jgi:hypothetical protein
MNKHKGFVFIEGAALLGIIALIAAGVATSNTTEKTEKKPVPVATTGSAEAAGAAEFKIAEANPSRSVPAQPSPN